MSYFLSLLWRVFFNLFVRIDFFAKPDIPTALSKYREQCGPLHAAAAFGTADELYSLLEDPEVDVNAEDQFGQTPLKVVGGPDLYQKAEMLLERGGSASLHAAVSHFFQIFLINKKIH